jgi:hypothetical protein
MMIYSKSLAFAVDTRSCYPACYSARFCKFTFFEDAIFSYCNVAYKSPQEELQLSHPKDCQDLDEFNDILRRRCRRRHPSPQDPWPTKSTKKSYSYNLSRFRRIQ